MSAALTPRLDPATLTEHFVLGNFLYHFGVAGVVLSCWRQGQVYQFAQWRSAWGKIMALGQCRHVCPDYSRYWVENIRGQAVASAGCPVNLSGLSDEQVLRRFVELVDCDAAMLRYNESDSDDCYFWRYRTRAGRTWVQQHIKGLVDSYQPLWNEVSWKQQAICPATYAEVVRATGRDSRLVTAARARRWGWDEAECTRINASQAKGE